MKMPIDEISKLDFETGSKLLKKATRKNEIDLEDCTYLASSLINLILKNKTLSQGNTKILDEALGVLMDVEQK